MIELWDLKDLTIYDAGIFEVDWLPITHTTSSVTRQNQADRTAQATRARRIEVGESSWPLILEILRSEKWI